MTITGAGLAQEVGVRQDQFRCFQDFAFDSLLPAFSGIHDQNDKEIAEITQRHWEEASDESGYVSYEDGGEILEGADDARSLHYEATNSIRE